MPAKKTRPPARKKAAPPANSALLASIKSARFVQFSANAQMLLLARPEKKSLALWHVHSADETPPLKSLAGITAVALSADSRYLAIGTSKGTLAVESTQAGKVAWKTKLENPAPIAEVLFSLDGSLVIAATHFREDHESWIRVFKTESGADALVGPASGFEPVPGATCCHLAVSPDGVFLAHSEERSHSVLVWHLPTRQMSACLRLPPRDGPIVRLAFGHTLRHLYVAQEKRLSGWSGENGIEFVNIATEGVRSLAVLSAGTALVSLRAGPDSAALNIWGAETGHLRKTIPLPPQDYGHLAAPPDGSLLALPAAKQCWVWRVDKLVT